MRVLIVGAGKAGTVLAKELAERGYEVIIVDKDDVKIANISREADVQAYTFDAVDPMLYEREIDLTTIDIVVAVTNRDEVNMFIATLAKEYDVPRIIVKVRDPKIAYIIERLGTEYIVVEPMITANIILGIIEGKKSVVNLVPVYTGYYQLISLTITEQDKAYRKSIGELNYPRDAAKILAVFDGTALRDPEEIEQLDRGHEIIALVREDRLEEFIKSIR